MILTEMVDRVLTKLKEETGSPVFWSRSELESSANDGYRDLCIGTGLYTTETTFNLVGAGVSTLTASGYSFTTIRAVKANGRPLRKINISKLFSTANGTPKYYCQLAHDKIKIGPPTSVTTDVIVTHDAIPAAIASGSSFIFTSPDLLDAIFYFTMSKALEKEGESQKFERAKFYFEKYTAIKSQYMEQ